MGSVLQLKILFKLERKKTVFGHWRTGGKTQVERQSLVNLPKANRRELATTCTLVDGGRNHDAEGEG